MHQILKFCQRRKIVIGVNVIHLFKIINTMIMMTLTIFIDNNHYKDGIV